VTPLLEPALPYTLYLTSAASVLPLPTSYKITWPQTSSREQGYLMS
jgi:hypothetical protein